MNVYLLDRAIFFLALIAAFAVATTSHAQVTTESVSFKSQALDAETTYIAIIPSPLKPDMEYPVLYFLHGATGSYKDWTEKTTLTEQLAGRHLIVITPDGGDYGWYVDSPVKASSRYDTLISTDVREHVENRYPTRKDRAGRAIAGLSMGGHGALSLAAKHPELYSSASSMSGILNVVAHPGKWKLDDVLGKQPEALPQWKEHSVLYLADTFTTANVNLLFDTGVEDKTGAVKDARDLHQAFEQLGVPHTYREFPGSHNWDYWGGHIAEHLDFHATTLRKPVRVPNPETVTK